MPPSQSFERISKHFDKQCPFNFSPKTKLIYIFIQAELVNSYNDFLKT